MDKKAKMDLAMAQLKPGDVIILRVSLGQDTPLSIVGFVREIDNLGISYSSSWEEGLINTRQVLRDAFSYSQILSLSRVGNDGINKLWGGC